MFLKTLTLKGFKSFADSTSLAMEPGVTVVVGPNGSGKSNVVDAIGWVLGAQAPSAVRSQKMDDVIFAGTSKRAALGRAEVGLTIDNSAGLLAIDFSEVTITRTLFRSGDSEYAINGVPCRLLDIQELLSDSGVGRQQHVIISQGQIDAVLNARAEDRRLIIEEAAGVLKYRRRKEKAERRLTSTDGNLTRIQDLLREVRRQLRPLERQADAARRHGSLVAELTALRIFVAGQELSRLRTRLEQGEATRRDLAGQERAHRSALANLDTEVMATEAQLSAMGGDDLGDDLARSESLREKARGLATLLTERRRGIDRDRGALVDRAVIATLEAEAARLAGELADVETESERLLPDAERLASAEGELAEQRERFQADWAGFEPIAPGGRAAEIRGELGALRASVERGQAEADRVQGRLGDPRRQGRAPHHRGRPPAGEVGRRGGGRGAVAPRARVRRGGRDHHRRVVAAAEEAPAADADADHAWAARAEALGLALDEARARAGAERLVDVDGVVGTLLDVVEIDPGWEAAFEAAAGEAIAAVVVADAGAGRRALEVLQGGDGAGSVLPLSGTVGAVSSAGRRVPAGHGCVRPVRGRCPAGPPDRPRRGGRLLAGRPRPGAGRPSRPRRHPGAVTASGPPAGGSAPVPPAPPERPSPRRRSAGDATSAVAADAERALVAARQANDAARARLADISRSLDQSDSRLSAAGDALQAAVESDRRDGTTEAEGMRTHLAELNERVQRDAGRVAELAEVLPVLEAEETEATARARAMAEARTAIEERASAVGALRSDLEVRSVGLDERRQFLLRRQSEIEERLERDIAERQQAEGRRLEIERRAVATDRLGGLVAERLAVLDDAVTDLRDRRRRQSEAARAVASRLDGLRRERSAAEKALSECRERLSRAEIDEAEVKLRIETAVEAIRRDLDMEPDATLGAPLPELAEGATAIGRTRELERELRLMGPINPLALEEYEALQERHQFLEAQLEDVKSSRRELARVIKAIDAEIVNVFASAFADVSLNFQALFETLFPGGRGRLTLTEPENLLETGIEIEAKPSGKNVKKLSLLSGGERSLTALAYLFAVFRARPSPFYVMDEVEAALDDVNLHRFLDLVHEFRQDAQLIIVSHQKRTMEAADCLYGVTMEPGGSSRVISEKVTSDL